MRERKDGLPMHAPISAICSLFLLSLFLPLSFLFSSLVLNFSLIAFSLCSSSLFVVPTSLPFYTSLFYGISPFYP